MIYAQKIQSEEGIQELLEYRFPELSGAQVEPPAKQLSPHAFCLGSDCNSSGPLIWIQNRLMESGQYYTHGGNQDDDPITFVRVVGGRKFAEIARTKFWDRAPIDKVFPINKTTVRVTGMLDLTECDRSQP